MLLKRRSEEISRDIKTLLRILARTMVTSLGPQNSYIAKDEALHPAKLCYLNSTCNTKLCHALVEFLSSVIAQFTQNYGTVSLYDYVSTYLHCTFI
jgi:hypothetical protein